MAYRIGVAKHVVEPDARPQPPGMVFRSALHRASAPAPAAPPRFAEVARTGTWQVLADVRAHAIDLGYPNMPRSMRRLALILAALALAGCGDELDELERPAPATEQGGAHNFDVERVATGLNRPLWVGAAPGDPGALWVLEQPGRVVRLGGRGADDAARHVRPGADRAPSRACSGSPSIPTSRPTDASSCTGPTAAATRAWPSSGRAATTRSSRGPCASC